MFLFINLNWFGVVALTNLLIWHCLSSCGKNFLQGIWSYLESIFLTLIIYYSKNLVSMCLTTLSSCDWSSIRFRGRIKIYETKKTKINISINKINWQMNSCVIITVGERYILDKYKLHLCKDVCVINTLFGVTPSR